MGKTKFILIYMVIAFLSITGMALFIWVDTNSSEKVMEKHITQVLQAQKHIYEIHTEKTFETLEQRALIYAGDKRIQQLFLNGVDAIEREGGGAGGEEAARFRDELYDLTGKTWFEIRKQYDARQLHFHMSPGSTSFLRVHRPEKFGDNMDSVRHTIVHTNATLKVTRGFETGRVFSGLRGVVPVFGLDSATGKQRHIGALETGMSLMPIITVLNNKYLDSQDHSHSLNAAALLNEKHLRQNVWPEFLEKLHGKNLFIKDYFIEAATNPGRVKKLFSHPEIINKIDIPGVHILKELVSPMAFISIPLHDFQSSSENASKGVGHILIWFDISGELNELQESLNKKGIIVLFIEIFILLFTFFVLRSLFNGFQHEVKSNPSLVKQRVEKDIQKNTFLSSETRLKNISESFADLVWVTDSSHILIDLSPSLERILGFKSEGISGGKIFDLLLPGEVERVEKIFATCAKDKLDVIDLESIFIHKNGEERTLVTSAIPLIADGGEFIGYRGVSRDITEQKCSAKLLQIRQNRTGFLKNLADSLSKPAQMIRSSAHSGITDSDTLSTEKMLECFNEIACYSNKILQILGDLRDLARLESDNINHTITGQDKSQDIASVVKEFLSFQDGLDRRLFRSPSSGHKNGDAEKLRQKDKITQ